MFTRQRLVAALMSAVLLGSLTEAFPLPATIYWLFLSLSAQKPLIDLGLSNDVSIILGVILGVIGTFLTFLIVGFCTLRRPTK